VLFIGLVDVPRKGRFAVELHLRFGDWLPADEPCLIASSCLAGASGVGQKEHQANHGEGKQPSERGKHFTAIEASRRRMHQSKKYIYIHFTRTWRDETTTSPFARPCSTTSRRRATSCSQ